MKPQLKAFAVGTAVGICLLFAVTTALSVVADSNEWSSREIGLLGAPIWTYERDGQDTMSTFGPGLLLAAILLGLLNALVGWGVEEHLRGKSR